MLNDLQFGGYLIWRQVPVFVDGRAELYGETFEMAYYRALQLKDVDGFLDLLKRYDIDAGDARPGRRPPRNSSIISMDGGASTPTIAWWSTYAAPASRPQRVPPGRRSRREAAASPEVRDIRAIRRSIFALLK